MTKKRFITLIATACIVAAVVWLLTIQKNHPRVARPTQNPPSMTSLAPTLPAPLPLEAVRYDTSRSTVSLPSTVAVYHVTPRPESAAQAQALARTLGVSTEPTTENTPDGPFYFFLSGNTSISIGPTMSHLSFSSSYPPSETKLAQPDTSFIESAKTTLAKTNLVPKEIALSSPEAAYFIQAGAHNEPAPRAQATIIQLMFHPTIEGIPFSLGYPEDTAIIVRVDGDGRLLSLSSPIFPVISKTNDAASLISIDEAKTKLIKGDGILLDADTGEEKEIEAASDLVFSSATITNGELALFWDPKKSFLVPVFLFTGIGTDNKSRRSITTTTLVSALP